MKKLTYFAALAGSLLFATSCVDLDQERQSFITEEDYIAKMDQAALENAVSALYNDLWYGNYGFNCRIQRIQVCADEITYRAAKAGNALAYYEELRPNITALNDDYAQTWEGFYSTINNANKLINKTVMPEEAAAADEYKRVLGEAYFLRALSYFYLVRMYGDVPLIMQETDASNNMPRTSVEEIYSTAIIPSLQRAIEWLPEEPRTSGSTPTKWAAETCLADVYITMAGWPLNKGQEYYELAASAAKDVLDNNQYHQQEVNYEDLWKESNKTSTEFMFCLFHSQANKVMPSNYGKSYYPADYYNNETKTVRNGWADYYARKEAFLNYPDDKRKDWNFMTEWYSTSNQVGTDENNKPIYGIVQWQNSPDGLPCISKYYDYDQGQAGQNAQANGVTSMYRLADTKLL